MSGMPLDNLIGWEVRRLRLAKQMTIPDLCRRLRGASISPEEFVLLETRSRGVADFEVKAIAQALGIQPERLFLTPQRNVPKARK
jgi:hypothetical protein